MFFENIKILKMSKKLFLLTQKNFLHQKIFFFKELNFFDIIIYGNLATQKFFIAYFIV